MAGLNKWNIHRNARSAGVIRSDGQLIAWGLNNLGQLTGASASYNPFNMSIGVVTSVSFGQSHTIALTNDNTLWLVGNGADYKLGTGNTTNRTTFTTQSPANGKTGKKVLATQNTSILLCTDGSIQTAGLFKSSTYTTFTHQSIFNGYNITDFGYSDLEGFLFITADNKVYCLGSFSSFTANSITEKTLPAGETPKQVFTGGTNRHFVLTNSGKIYVIGSSADSPNAWPGISSTATTLTLLPTPSNKAVKWIATGNEHTIIITTDNLVYASGLNADGRLGIGNNTDQSAWVQVTSLKAGRTPIAMGAGQLSSYIIYDDGSVQSTGYNTTRELGDGTTTSRNVFTNIAQVSAATVYSTTTTGLDSAPGAPTIGTVTPGNQQVSVAFTAPASNGGQAITGYTVTVSPGGATTTGASSPIVVTGLTNGNAYTFTVTATNSVGTSVASSASASVTPRTVPGAPTIGSATPGNQQVSVAFTAPASTGGSAITGYTVTASPGGATATGASSPLVVTGLTNGTDYTFTVKATNVAGDSSASSATATVTPRTVPGAPTSVVGTAGYRQVSVAFTAPVSNGGSAITGYTVTASPGGATATGVSSPLVVTGLSDATAYTFTVKATNVAGDSSASSASASVTTTGVPGAPTAVSATGANRQATVTFTAPASTGGSAITGYTVTASPGGATATGASSPLVVTGLTNGTAYTFTVKATNVAGDSSGSLASNSVTPSVSVPDLNSGNISTSSDDIVVTGSRTITAKKQAKSAGAVTYAPDAANKPSVTISSIPTAVQNVTIGVAATDASGIAVVKIVAQDSSDSLITDFAANPLTVRVTLPGFTASMVTIQTSATLGGSITDTITAYKVGTNLYEFTTTHLTYFSASQYVPCFVAGTRIRTAEGYKAVETLTADDLIRTADNRIVPFRMFKTHIVATSPETAPYTIPANTFGRACPAKELTVSPYHAIQSDSNTWQIPKYAAQMFSGITQARPGQAITYYHLELPNYFKDNIVAEGTVVESYGNRQTAGMKTVYRLNAERTGFTRMEKTKSASKTA